MYHEVLITPTATTNLHKRILQRFLNVLELQEQNVKLLHISLGILCESFRPRPRLPQLLPIAGRLFLLHTSLVQALSFTFLGRPVTLRQISPLPKSWGHRSRSRARRKFRKAGTRATRDRSFTTSRTRPQRMNIPRTRWGSARIPTLLSLKNTIAGVTKKRTTKKIKK